MGFLLSSCTACKWSLKVIGQNCGLNRTTRFHRQSAKADLDLWTGNSNSVPPLIINNSQEKFECDREKMQLVSCPHSTGISIIIWDISTSNIGNRDICFNTPVFKRDVLCYGDVCPGIPPGLHPSIRPSVSHSFPYFSLKCLTYWAENLQMTLFYCTTDQVRASSICVIFCGSYAPLGLRTLEITVFHTFLLHALTYWAEILHMTLFYYTTDQVLVSSICLNFLLELCPFWNLEYWKYTVFHIFLLYALTYWAEILHMTLFYCTTD